MTAFDVVNMLWIGSAPGRIEKLSMVSFLANGHTPVLYAYGDVPGIPKGVRLRDANEIVPFARMARLRHTGTSSYSLGSNLFRYRLFEKGRGLWADCDIVCLKPIERSGPFLAGYEVPDRLGTAILHIEQGQPMIDDLLDLFRPGAIPPWLPPRKRFRARVKKAFGLRPDPGRYPWGTFGPLAVTALASRHGLLDRAEPQDVFYPHDYDHAGWIVEPGRSLSSIVTERTRAIHLWNSYLGSGKVADPDPDTPLAELYAKFGV